MTTEELALEVERLRGVLARIESLVWYEPQDDDDTVESVRAMVRERDEARAEVERLREAAASSMALCSWECSDETYCGRCKPLVRALNEADE